MTVPRRYKGLRMSNQPIHDREFYYIQFLRKAGSFPRARGRHSLPGWRNVTDHQGRTLNFFLLSQAERQVKGLVQRPEIERARIVIVKERHFLVSETCAAD